MFTCQRHVNICFLLLSSLCLPGTNFSVITGGVINSASSSYVVQDFVGEGSFGEVVQCVKMPTNEKVALKIFKERPLVIAAAEREVNQNT